MELYLALDVGGTKTAALLADGTRELARAEGGSIKTLRVPADEAAENLQSVLAELATRAGMASLHGHVVRTCIGTSGASAPGVRSWMRDAFAQSVGGDFLLLGDEVIALDAAFPGARGVLVIAGTGSNIVGRSKDGEMAHTGGWGPALADEGSGHWIGTEALRASFRAIDRARPSSADAVSVDGYPEPARFADLPPLLTRFLRHLGLETFEEIIGVANAPSFRSAALVPVVMEAAQGGDEIAETTLRHAGEDLARLVAEVVGKVRILEQDENAPAPEVAFVGGVLAHIAEVHTAMASALAQQFPGIVVQTKPVDPLLGALFHARHAERAPAGGPLRV